MLQLAKKNFVENILENSCGQGGGGGLESPIVSDLFCAT